MAKRKAPRPPMQIRVDTFTWRADDGMLCPGARISCDTMPPSINQITSMVPLQRAREAKLWRSQFAVATEGSPVKFSRPVRLDVIYFPATHREFDLLNYPPKWAIDGLVDAGVIAGDSYRHMPVHSISFGRVDKTRHRFEMLIREVEPTEWVVMR